MPEDLLSFSPCVASHQNAFYNNLPYESIEQKVFYEEDEVCRISPDGKIQFGLVSQAKIGSESPSGLQIFWTLGRNIVDAEDLNLNKISHIRLMNRKVQRGDLIYTENDREAEVVDEPKFIACLKCMDNNEAIVDIPCENLEPIIPFRKGQKLLFQGWLGIIKSFETCATLMLSNGSTFDMDLNRIISSNKDLLYPGVEVIYTLRELLLAGATTDGKSLIELFGKEMNQPVPATIVFVKIGSVQVGWLNQMPQVEPSNMKPPKTSLGGDELRKYARIIDPPTQLIWGTDNPEIYENFYRYNVQKEDMVLTKCSVNLERLLVSQLFPEKKVHPVQISSVVEDITYTTGEVSVIRSRNVIYKQNVKAHQFVQRKLLLDSTSSVKFGFPLNRDTNDIVTVQWYEKNPTPKGPLEIMECTKESKYDVEPHFLYGNFLPGEIVHRTNSCNLPIDLFTYGVVQSINPQGYIFVENSISNKIQSFLPFEIDTVGVSAEWMRLPLPQDKDDNPKKLIPIEVYGENWEKMKIIRSYFSPSLFVNYKLNNDQGKEQKFQLVDVAPESHEFYDRPFVISSEYTRAIGLERVILNNVFAEGIWVKGYGNRVDLYSAMVVGAEGTLVEYGLFLFDIQLPLNYPKQPPLIYLSSILSKDLKNNEEIIGTHNIDFRIGSLRVDGVDPPVTVLETLVSLQKGLFKADPTSFINNNSNCIQREVDMGAENKRQRNSKIILNVIDALFDLMANPPKIWKTFVLHHFQSHGLKIRTRLAHILDCNALYASQAQIPEEHNNNPFYILPLTKGLIQAIENRIKKFDEFNRIQQFHQEENS